MDGDGRREMGLPPPLDYCPLTPYQRQKQKDAILAKPRMVASYTTLFGQPRKAAKAELIAKCSPHTEMLAMPRWPLPKMHYVTKAEKEAEREIREEMTKEELRWLMRKPLPPFVSNVKKSALTAKGSPRLDLIAMAKLNDEKPAPGARSVPSHFPQRDLMRRRKRKAVRRDCGCAEHIKAKLNLSSRPLVINKQMFFDKLPKTQKDALQRHIRENLDDFNTRYPPDSDKIYEIVNGVILHATCADRGDAQTWTKRMYICELNKTQRKLFRKRMKALSLPRIHLPPSSGPDRGPKKRIKEFEPWLTVISQPRYNVLNEVHYNPFQVKASAKKYTATDRILMMSKPKVPPPPPPLLDFEGNELPPRREWSYNSRRRIIASPRTIELSTPRFVKKKAAEDTKEDPFAVPRRALTAICTPRTKELAEPKKRG